MDHRNIRPMLAKGCLDAWPIDAVEVEDISKAVPKSTIEAFGAADGKMFLRAEVAFEGSREYAPDAVRQGAFYPDHKIGARKAEIEGKERVVAVGDPAFASDGLR